MSLINLNRNERDRFVAYLFQEAESEKLLIEQCRKLGPGGEIVIPRMKQHMAACMIVASKLKGVDEVTVSAGVP